MTIADKTFTSPWDIFPEAATGQELGHAANLWDLFTREVTFNAASGANVITVPDNLASAVELVDAGGIEYMRVDTQNAQPAAVWNEGGADVDFRWEGVGAVNALFIQGSDGFVGSGTAAPEAKFHNIDDAFPVMLNERTVSAATGRVGSYLLKVTTSANMTDGLGPGMYFAIEDDAAVQNLIGAVSVVRSGADNSGMLRLETYNAGALGPKVYVTPSGRVGILAATPAAQLHVDQSSTTAAIPVLYLDQADISEELIEFNSTIGVGNAIEAVGAKVLTVTHFLKVTLPGPLTRYIPCGTIA